MKTQNKNGHGLYLQKRNNHWKLMAGATAATAAAGMTASQAGMVTINLSNNYISGSGGNHLNADVTGDGHTDLTITDVSRYFINTSASSREHYVAHATAFLNGIRAAGYLHFDIYTTATLGSQRRTRSYLRSHSLTLTGSIPIFFKDLHINGGTPTAGSLEVSVSLFSDGAKIQLDSLTYNTPTQSLARAVPDHESSLALLAMGAGGVLALRRWRAAQGRS